MVSRQLASTLPLARPAGLICSNGREGVARAPAISAADRSLKRRRKLPVCGSGLFSRVFLPFGGGLNQFATAASPADASPQHVAVDLRERQPLLIEGVLGAQAGVVHPDGSVLPVEIRQQDFADRGKLWRRPGTAPGQLDVAPPHLGAPGDRGRLGQVKTDVIIRRHLGLAEILHRPLGLQARAPRSRLKGSHHNAVPGQAEVRLGGPGKGTITIERGVGFAQQKVSLVAAAKKRVAHVGGHVPQFKIERDSPVTPDHLAAAHFKTGDREREQALHRALVGKAA